MHSTDRAYYTVPHLGTRSQNYDNSEFVNDDVTLTGRYNVIEPRSERASGLSSGAASTQKEHPVDVDMVQLTNDFFRANEHQRGSAQADRSVEEVQLQEVLVHNGKSDGSSTLNGGEKPMFNERAVDVSLHMYMYNKNIDLMIVAFLVRFKRMLRHRHCAHSAHRPNEHPRTESKAEHIILVHPNISVFMLENTTILNSQRQNFKYLF